MPPLDTVIYLDFEKFVENLNKLPDDADTVIRNIAESGSRIGDIIDSCGGDRLSSAAHLKQLFDFGVISAENKEDQSGDTQEERVEKPSGNAGKTVFEEKSESVSAPLTKSAVETKASAWDELAEQSARRGKSGRIALFVLLLALLAAIVMFMYYRGLI